MLAFALSKTSRKSWYLGGSLALISVSDKVVAFSWTSFFIQLPQHFLNLLWEPYR